MLSTIKRPLHFEELSWDWILSYLKLKSVTRMNHYNNCVCSWKIKSLMSPKLIISKQREEYMELMTAKMNLLANKTGEILIWSCPHPAVKSLMNVRDHSLSRGQSAKRINGFWLGKGNNRHLYGESPPFLTPLYSLFPVALINTVIVFSQGFPVLWKRSHCFKAFHDHDER